MADRVTLGVQFDPDDELLEEFEEYKDSRGFTSRAETMRHLMREQLQSDSAPGQEDTTSAASRSTLTAVALYAVAEIATFPAAARYTLFGAAFVFAAAGVAGYGRALVDMTGKQIEIGSDDGEDEDNYDESALASISPVVRLVGGALMLLALGFTAVSGVL